MTHFHDSSSWRIGDTKNNIIFKKIKVPVCCYASCYQEDRRTLVGFKQVFYNNTKRQQEQVKVSVVAVGTDH